ncbi:hypothetical protein ACFQ1I_46475 [Kitasatospora arboriphila]
MELGAAAQSGDLVVAGSEPDPRDRHPGGQGSDDVAASWWARCSRRAPGQSSGASIWSCPDRCAGCGARLQYPALKTQRSPGAAGPAP